MAPPASRSRRVRALSKCAKRAKSISSGAISATIRPMRAKWGAAASSFAALAALLVAAPTAFALAWQTEQSQSSNASKPQAQANPTQSQSPAKPGKSSPAKPDQNAELDKAIDSAGNDRAALVRNLEDYLKRFPDTPRKSGVYRALLEAELQLREPLKAIDYAERIIALEPDDSSTMLLAATLLEEQGGDDRLTRAGGYVTRVLDRVEKTTITDKPARDSEVDWVSQQKHVEMTLYLLRGRLEMEKRDNADAINDFETSYKLSPNPSAALQLGEIAESKGNRELAINEYLIAFVLPNEEGASVDRADVRRKLGNVWQITHGAESGLGERILATYDEVSTETKLSAAGDVNKDAKDPYGFVLRRADGSAALKMDANRGKVVVLEFWATWCTPCREMAPLISQVAGMFNQGNDDLVFLAVNDDEDETRVPAYLSKQKMHGTIVFADGLDTLLAIDSLPTIIILDRNGKIAYRADGFDPDTFVETLHQAIVEALNSTADVVPDKNANYRPR